MRLRRVLNKTQRFVYIVSGSLFASTLLGAFTGIGAKIIFGLTEDHSVFLITIPVWLISLIFFIPYASKEFDGIVAGKQTWYQKNRGKEIPEWVTFLVLASFTALTFYFLNKYFCCRSS